MLHTPLVRAKDHKPGQRSVEEDAAANDEEALPPPVVTKCVSQETADDGGVQQAHGSNSHLHTFGKEPGEQQKKAVEEEEYRAQQPVAPRAVSEIEGDGTQVISDSERLEEVLLPPPPSLTSRNDNNARGGSSVPIYIHGACCVTQCVCVCVCV